MEPMNLQITEFSNQILKIGEGSGQVDESDTWIDIPTNMRIIGFIDPMKQIMEVVLPNLRQNCKDGNYHNRKQYVLQQLTQLINDYNKPN